MVPEGEIVIEVTWLLVSIISRVMEIAIYLRLCPWRQRDWQEEASVKIILYENSITGQLKL